MHFLGASGQRWPEYGDLQGAYCGGLFRSYYRDRHWIQTKTIQKYISGVSQVPEGLVRYYAGPHGKTRLYGDMRRMVYGTYRIAQLQTMYLHISIWETGCERTEAITAPTRDDMIEYLTETIHHLLS